MAATGGCLCGAVRYSFAAEPVFQAICHCRNCQKQAGSAFSIVVGVPQGALTIEGEPATYEDRGESGGAVLRQFCARCGTPLFSRADTVAGLVIVKAGTLDDTSGFSPQAQVWTKSKQHWVDLGPVPAFQTSPHG